MGKMTTKIATKLCRENLGSIFGFNDVIDIRTRKVNFQIYSCRLIGDSCVIIIANNFDECRKYITTHVGATEYAMADSNDFPEPYNRMSCWAGYIYGEHCMYTVIYRFDNNKPYGNVQNIKEYIKTLA